MMVCFGIVYGFKYRNNEMNSSSFGKKLGLKDL